MTTDEELAEKAENYAANSYTISGKGFLTEALEGPLKRLAKLSYAAGALAERERIYHELCDTSETLFSKPLALVIHKLMSICKIKDTP